jgi:hypothetical protein
MTDKPKYYRWSREDGVVDQDGHQEIQLVGGTKRFRHICGTLLVERLNVKERGDFYAKKNKCEKQEAP